MLTKLNWAYSAKGRQFYYYGCSCGNIAIFRSDSTSSSCRLPSCNVANSPQSHGESNTRLYAIWSGMRDRCLNDHHSAIHYKGKGICIAPEWSRFVFFKEWSMANGYTDELTIDRIDINGDYSPSNCEWVTRATNTRRQVLDGHGNNKKVSLTCLSTKETSVHHSIADAARKVSLTVVTTVKAIQATLERRIKNNSDKPYHDYVISMVTKEGSALCPN